MKVYVVCEDLKPVAVAWTLDQAEYLGPDFYEVPAPRLPIEDSYVLVKSQVDGLRDQNGALASYVKDLEEVNGALHEENRRLKRQLTILLEENDV